MIVYNEKKNALKEISITLIALRSKENKDWSTEKLLSY